MKKRKKELCGWTWKDWNLTYKKCSDGDTVAEFSRLIHKTKKGFFNLNMMQSMITGQNIYNESDMVRIKITIEEL